MTAFFYSYHFHPVHNLILLFVQLSYLLRQTLIRVSSSCCVLCVGNINKWAILNSLLSFSMKMDIEMSKCKQRWI